MAERRKQDSARASSKQRVPQGAQCAISPSSPTLWSSFKRKERASVGIEIGHKELHFTRLTFNRSNVESVQYVQAPLAETDHNDIPLLAGKLSAAFAQLCGKDRKSMSVWGIVTTDRVDMRELQIPKVPGNQIANAVYWTAKKAFSFEDADVVFDFEIRGTVQDKGTEKITVFAYTIPREEVEKYQSIFEAANIKLTGLTIPPFCNQNLVRLRWLPVREKVVANLHIGHSYSRVEIYEDSQLILSRMLKAGMIGMENSLLEAVNEKLLEKPTALEQPAPANTPAHLSATTSSRVPSATTPSLELELEPLDLEDEAPNGHISSDILYSASQKASQQTGVVHVLEKKKEVEEPESVLVLDAYPPEIPHAPNSIELPQGKLSLELEPVSEPLPTSPPRMPESSEKATDGNEHSTDLSGELELMFDQETDSAEKDSTTPKPLKPDTQHPKAASITQQEQQIRTDAEHEKISARNVVETSLTTSVRIADADADTDKKSAESISDTNCLPKENDDDELDPSTLILSIADERVGVPRKLAERGVEKADIFEMVTPALERLLRQVEMTFKHYTVTLGHGAVRQMFVSGPLSPSRFLLDYFSDNLDMPVQTLDPLANRRVFHPSMLDPDLNSSARGTMRLSTAAAISNNALTPNLLYTYKEKELTNKSNHANKMLLIACLCIFIVMCGVFGWQILSRSAKHVRIAQLRDQLSAQETNVDMATLRSSSTKATLNLQYVRQYAAKNQGVALLNEIFLITPDDIRLSSVSIQLGSTPASPDTSGKAPKTEKKNESPLIRAKLVVIDGFVFGVSESQESELAGYMAILNQSKLISNSNISLTQKETAPSGEGVLRFVITAEIS